MLESLKQIKNKLESNTTLSDEIIYILKQLEEKQIPTDRALIHPAFHEMSLVTKKLKISRLIFDTSPIIPYSEELENALFILEASGILPYYIGPTCKYDLSFLNQERNFNETEKEELNKSAQILRKALTQKSN